MQHLDSNGIELQVGDTVSYGLSEGTVLILEDWSEFPRSPDAGVYVSNIGQWGDCRAVAASTVTKVFPAECAGGCGGTAGDGCGCAAP
jgi:hypothetical protein